MALIDHVQRRRQMVRYAIRAASLSTSHPDRQLDGHPILCEHSCAFRRWYADAGDNAIVTASYGSLAAPHANLHRLGRAVVHGARRGAALGNLADFVGAEAGIE